MTRRIKYGRLYWMPIEADDLDQFFWVRFFRKFGIDYLPLTLGRYQELYLREDRSRYSRKLINRCRKLGIVTLVVQEGPIYHPHQARWSHLPLYADLFLCPDGDRDLWINEGMPKDCIKTYALQRRRGDYRAVAVLEPLVTWKECPDPSIYARNAAILNSVYELMGEDVAFAPNPRNAFLIEPYLPPHRIVRGNPEDAIKGFETVHCFSGSVVEEACRRLGKKRITIDLKRPLPQAGYKPQGKMEAGGVRESDGEGVALLGSPVTWNDLGFTWRKDGHNERVFASLAEVAAQEIMLKPHYAHADLILPFLPPDRVTWEAVESLIARHREIYCFWDSSVRKDCEMLGKTPRLIGVPAGASG